MAENIGEDLERVLDDHLKKLRKSIVQKAVDLDPSRAGVTIAQLAEAIKIFAPGNEIPESEPMEKKALLLTYFPPSVVFSGVLALAFAALGLWATLGMTDAKSSLVGGQGFLEIAKILAGTVIGSASATALSLKRSKS